MGSACTQSAIQPVFQALFAELLNGKIQLGQWEVVFEIKLALRWAFPGLWMSRCLPRCFPMDVPMLLEDIHAHVKGKKKLTLRTREVTLPDPAPEVLSV
jgi:hypothetical protein